MEVISETLKIYRIKPDEMTIGQIRKYFSNFSDDSLVGNFSVFYDSDQDIVYFGSKTDSEDFCIRMLSDLRRAEIILPNYFNEVKSEFFREVISVLINCVNIRLSKIPADVPVINPDSRFITIADDIFQISKIVSVRRSDEGSRSYLEVLITNKRASIKKEFSSRAFRDSEYSRIISILQAAA